MGKDSAPAPTPSSDSVPETPSASSPTVVAPQASVVLSPPPTTFDCVAVFPLSAGSVQALDFDGIKKKAIFGMFSSARLLRIRAEVHHIATMDGFVAAVVGETSPTTIKDALQCPVVSFAYAVSGSPVILSIDTTIPGFGREVKRCNTEGELPVLSFLNLDSSLAKGSGCGHARVILTFECSGSSPIALFN